MFALYEAKVALVSAVSKYRLIMTANTPEKLHIDPRSNMLPVAMIVPAS